MIYMTLKSLTENVFKCRDKPIMGHNIFLLGTYFPTLLL